MTELLFRADAYQTAADCKVIGLTPEGGILVDRSLFYATGGGQPGDSGMLEHSGAEDMGENLWMGTSGAFTPEDMVGAWLAERQDYQDGAFPAVSRTGNWRDVGHYTQIIWHNTKQIGCAIASNASDDVLVCRYDPPGNWMGQYATRAR